VDRLPGEKFNPWVKFTVKPKDKLYSVGGKYASTLFMIAANQNVLEQVGQDLKNIQTLRVSKAKERMESIFEDPTMKEQERQQHFEKIYDRLKVTPVTKHFIDQLIKRRRTSVLDKINDSYEHLMRSHRNEVLITVYTPKALANDQLSTLKTELQQKFLEKGQIPIMKQEVDINLIGGMKLLIGEREIDWSVETRMKGLLENVNALIRRHFDTKIEEIQSAYRAQGGRWNFPSINFK